jgi:tRNA(fMet)-specific endonuclease VapC
MKYILDTNTVSALMQGDPRAVDQLARVDRNDVAVPQPVFAEIAYGIARLSKSKRKHALRECLALLRSELKSAAWSDDVSDAYGEIKANLERAGTRIEDFDAAIAAHAQAQGAVLVTANVKHMARVPQLIVADWLSDG